MKTLTSRQISIFIVLASGALTALSFQNCSRVEFQAVELASKQTQAAAPEQEDTEQDQPVVMPTPESDSTVDEPVEPTPTPIVIEPTPEPTPVPTPMPTPIIVAPTPIPTPVATPVPSPTPVPQLPETETFTVETKGKLDIIWAIDNSESMTEEAAHVRANFQKFIDFIQPKADLRLVLISKKYDANTRDKYQGKNGVTLPASAQADPTRFKQIDVYVGSHAPLAAVAHMICPSNAAAGSPCRSFDNVSDGDVLEAQRGALRSFLRPEAKKMLIFVTDDNSDLPAANFRSAWGSVYSNIAPSINGFVALNGSSTRGSECVAAKSTEYLNLKTSTSEKMVNVCSTDWSSHFDSLATTAVELAQTAYTLKHQNVVSVTSVTLSGTVVDPRYYALNGNVVQLDSSLVSSASTYNVVIKYVYRSSQ